VQYVAMPKDDYGRLRQTSPGLFVNAVDASVAPSGWNRLRIVLQAGRVQVFVGQGRAAALDVAARQPQGRGLVGLYVDNGSDGVFANVRVKRDD